MSIPEPDHRKKLKRGRSHLSVIKDTPSLAAHSTLTSLFIIIIFFFLQSWDFPSCSASASCTRRARVADRRRRRRSSVDDESHASNRKTAPRQLSLIPLHSTSSLSVYVLNTLNWRSNKSRTELTQYYPSKSPVALKDE